MRLKFCRYAIPQILDALLVDHSHCSFPPIIREPSARSTEKVLCHGPCTVCLSLLGIQTGFSFEGEREGNRFCTEKPLSLTFSVSTISSNYYTAFPLISANAAPGPLPRYMERSRQRRASQQWRFHVYGKVREHRNGTGLLQQHFTEKARSRRRTDCGPFCRRECCCEEMVRGLFVLNSLTRYECLPGVPAKGLQPRLQKPTDQ